MSITLRIILIVCAVLMTAYAAISVRKSHMCIEDSVFWLGLSALVLILGIFPQVGFFFSEAFGFMAPVNFVFAFIIFVLVAKCLSLSCRVSELECNLRDLTQQVAVDELTAELEAQTPLQESGAMSTAASHEPEP